MSTTRSSNTGMSSGQLALDGLIGQPLDRGFSVPARREPFVPAEWIQQVFDAWREATGKIKAKLDDARRAKIRAALLMYPLRDVIDAVRGWKKSPFYCGKNDRERAYNDLGLLLRNADKIEFFRDLERGVIVDKRSGESGSQRAWSAWREA